MLVEAPKPSWTDRILLLDLFAGIRTTVKEFFKRPKFTVEYPEGAARAVGGLPRHVPL